MQPVAPYFLAQKQQSEKIIESVHHRIIDYFRSVFRLFFCLNWPKHGETRWKAWPEMARLCSGVWSQTMQWGVVATRL